MPRQKRYIDADVLTEARARIRHIYDVFDAVAVMFSGGKDSLTCLHLVKEFHDENGLGPVNVVFRDEELIPQSVIDFVDLYRRQPWVNMLYYCYPLASKKYVLGRTFQYVQWDPGRRHCRPMPEWALKLETGDTRVFDQYSMDAEVAKNFKGKVCFVTGIRADESIVRFRSAVNKLNENYITKPMRVHASDKVPPNVMLAKPIFDWTENDIFLFLYQQGIAYCRHYDNELWGGQRLRVSTPIHAEDAKSFHKLKAIDPVLYQQVIDIFPEMLAHERYYRDMDRAAVLEKYAQSIEGIRSWIEENITDEHELALAESRLKSVESWHLAAPEAYPLRHILRAFMGGGYKREILPEVKNGKA